METWVITWIAIAPGSSQRVPFASMYRAGNGAEAARQCEKDYGNLASFKILVMHQMVA